VKQAAGGFLTAKQAPRRPGTAPAPGLRAGRVVPPLIEQTAVAKKRYRGVPMSLLEVEVPRASAEAGGTPPEGNGAPPTREVRHEYTHSLPPLLSRLGVSPLVSTCQAGKGDAALFSASANPGTPILLAASWAQKASLSTAERGPTMIERLDLAVPTETPFSAFLLFPWSFFAAFGR
jgi:hypothetical protein